MDVKKTGILAIIDISLCGISGNNNRGSCIFLCFDNGAGTIFYYEGLRRNKAAQVGALELAMPFFAALFGFFILKERVTVMQIAGIVLLFVGVYLLSKKET